VTSTFLLPARAAEPVALGHFLRLPGPLQILYKGQDPPVCRPQLSPALPGRRPQSWEQLFTSWSSAWRATVFLPELRADRREAQPAGLRRAAKRQFPALPPRPLMWNSNLRLRSGTILGPADATADRVDPDVAAASGALEYGYNARSKAARGLASPDLFTCPQDWLQDESLEGIAANPIKAVAEPVALKRGLGCQPAARFDRLHPPRRGNRVEG